MMPCKYCGADTKSKYAVVCGKIDCMTKWQEEYEKGGRRFIQ